MLPIKGEIGDVVSPPELDAHWVDTFNEHGDGTEVADVDGEVRLEDDAAIGVEKVTVTGSQLGLATWWGELKLLSYNSPSSC